MMSGASTTPVRLVRTKEELSRARGEMGGRVAVVMTMGALHAGHAALLKAARGDADHVIATIFVNPLQFGPTEDYGRYPRTLEADLELCAAEGVDVVFAPAPEEMYPGGEPRVRVAAGPLAAILEGEHRPGHFDGVLTVVLKLLHLTRPHRAYFGEKDYQQLTLIRTMVEDLDLDVDIVAVPTVREDDGLALSSRNRYLDSEQRRSALALSAALRAGQAVARQGGTADEVLAAAKAKLAQAVGVTADYVALTDPWLGPAPPRGEARLLVAARVGDTRLIDNLAIRLEPKEP